MTNYTLHSAVKFDTKKEMLIEFAKYLSVKIGKDDDERAIASAIIDKTNNFNDAQWDKMVEENEALGYFVNDINTQIQDLPPEDNEPAASGSESEEDPVVVLETDINGAKSKKAVQAKADELKKEFDIEISFLAKDTMAVMKTKLIEAMKAKLSPKTESAAPAAKASIPRVRADASAPDPGADAVAAKKDAARTTATTAKGKAPKGANEGEPYREGSNAHCIFLALKKSRKKSTPLDDVVESATAIMKDKNVACSNIHGRTKAILSHMVRNGFAVKNADDGYSLKE